MNLTPPPDFQRARFLTSAAKPEQAPADTGAEIAFAGRSNAGKSSALNVLVGQRALARTSKTPGRTQLLNFFSMDDGDEQRLVDLPGYGYAKVPEAQRRAWRGMMEGYMTDRQALRGLVLIMDARHPMKPFDEQMLDWCRHQALPVHILLTKADKLSRSQAQQTLQQVRRQLSNDPDNISVQLFSALKRTGVEEARTKLSQWFV